MTGSIFEKTTLADIYEEISTLYLSDNRPWILGYSGGKDSTCMIQLVWSALSKLSPEKLQKKIFIISSDTLVESPKIVEKVTGSLDKMELEAKKQHLPVETNLVRPVLQDTFWVCLLGKGYPAPSTNFRWCTDRLKIINANRFITEKVSEYGEAILLLGSRKDESASRQQVINLHEIKGSLLSRHSHLTNAFIYLPLRDFTTEDVWNYLLQNKNPWNDNNRDLLALYQNANAAECPLVVDTSTPSCGNSRFGCWVCTVVSEDKSMKNLIENGEEWMEPLFELRQELKRTQDPLVKTQVREIKRRNGRVQFIYDQLRTSSGPYTFEYCKKFFRDLLKTQNKVQKTGPDPNMTLISEEEIHEIQRIWRMERGDWENSAYQIYLEETGKKLDTMQEDLGGFSQVEQEILHEVCEKNKISQVLVSRLLNTEFESQGMTKHSKIYPKINKILSEEWRDDLDEIVEDLQNRREEKAHYK